MRATHLIRDTLTEANASVLTDENRRRATLATRLIVLVIFPVFILVVCALNPFRSYVHAFSDCLAFDEAPSRLTHIAR